MIEHAARPASAPVAAVAVIMRVSCIVVVMGAVAEVPAAEMPSMAAAVMLVVSVVVISVGVVSISIVHVVSFDAV
jgi:hypothetical protein